jgi:hypothetical protein
MSSQKEKHVMSNPLNTAAIDFGAWTGRVQALQFVRGSCSLTRALTLKELKDSRLYEQFGLTWEQACEQCGISRAHADREIDNLDELGAAYHRLSDIARISPQFFRQISDKVDDADNTIELNGQKIAIAPENAAAIRAGIKELRAQARAELIRDQTRTVNAAGDLFFRFDAITADCAKFLSNGVYDGTARYMIGLLYSQIDKMQQLIKLYADSVTDPAPE